MTTVWIYTNTRKEVGDIDHLKVVAVVFGPTASRV